MPTYTFRNVETDEVFTDMMTISQMEEYLQNNPSIKQIIGAPAIGDPVRLGVHKIDRGFNDVLHKAKSAHPKGNVETHY